MWPQIYKSLRVSLCLPWPFLPRVENRDCAASLWVISSMALWSTFHKFLIDIYHMFLLLESGELVPKTKLFLKVHKLDQCEIKD